MWSVACATGEEPYTLALLACEAFASAAPPVRILATDISAAALERALAGRYGDRSVRSLDPILRSRYFQNDRGLLVAGDRLRALVKFAPHNLARDPIPPLGEAPFDLVLCRNVLIYFDTETVGRVIDSLERATQPEGMLVLGAADTLCGTARRLSSPAARDSAPVPRRAAPRILRRPIGRRSSEQQDEQPEPFDAEAYFLQGLRSLETGDPRAAASALRRALYVDPTFGLAAFSLGRAHEEAGDMPAARRAYEQALRTLDLADDRHDHLLAQIDLSDVASACRARLWQLWARARAW